MGFLVSFKNYKICNFWATQTLYTSKESWEQSSFRFEIKFGDFVVKKMKKIDFVIFDPKKSWSRLGLGWISGTPVKIVKKWLDYLVLGMFFDKVKKFCDHSMILWEMAGVLLTNRLNQPPPAVFRVKKRLWNTVESWTVDWTKSNISQ